MSLRLKSDSKDLSNAITSACPDRLTAVLSASLHNLSLAGLERAGDTEDTEDTEMPYGNKRSMSGSVKSNVAALGLELNSLYFPSVRIGDTRVRLGKRLSTVTLRRPNTGTAPGVVFDSNATVLIINATSGYSDRYLSFINKARVGAPTAQLPDIEYSFPIPQGRMDASAYVKNARRHLVGLIKSATLESTGQSDFTHDYEQPLSKIYVFIKKPVSGYEATLPEGPYIYLGRFKTLPNERLVTDYGNGRQYSSLNENRLSSLKLRPFDTPTAPDNPTVQSSKPSTETTTVQEDIQIVIGLLERLAMSDEEE